MKRQNPERMLCLFQSLAPGFVIVLKSKVGHLPLFERAPAASVVRANLVSRLCPGPQVEADLWHLATAPRGPPRSVCPGPSVPLLGRQGSQGCILDLPRESGLVLCLDMELCFPLVV